MLVPVVGTVTSQTAMLHAAGLYLPVCPPVSASSSARCPAPCCLTACWPGGRPWPVPGCCGPAQHCVERWPEWAHGSAHQGGPNCHQMYDRYLTLPFVFKTMAVVFINRRSKGGAEEGRMTGGCMHAIVATAACQDGSSLRMQSIPVRLGTCA